MSENDLRTIVKGSPEKVMIKDRFGREHELCPLDLADLIEYEEKTGATLLGREFEFKMKHLGYLLYLSLRKDGLSLEDVEKRRFKVSEQTVMVWFDLKVLAQANEVITDLLRVSGLLMPKEEENKDPLEPKPSGNIAQ